MSANRLATSTSPYLLQHADNPVAWYPWGKEALERARAEDKPILLSIGYAACHWCHVMAHESFEDPATAEVMNRHFINIKVDREERPDLDRIYQFAFSALNRRGGGWPLTAFLDPHDLHAFFAGTYFPRDPLQGMPGFADVLERIATAWQEQRETIRQQNQQLAQLFSTIDGDLVPTALSRGPLAAVGGALEGVYDTTHGGFGRQPKFPQPGALRLCLEAPDALREGGRDPRSWVEHTLEAMARGGIHDQVGGGFARYSVDDAWEIPHFEKMLYDNALLLGLYADAAVCFHRDDFARLARETAAWAQREMTAPGGGFCSSLDADSEGEEGRFYVWDRTEVQRLLTEEEFRLIERHFGLDRPPNFEGRWHPVVAVSVDTLAEETGHDPAVVRERIDTARGKLYAARAARVWPERDDKVLTAWNAMMIEGLATAGLRLGDSDLIDRAAGTLDFLYETCWREGRLYAVHRNGVTHQPAFLEDHAWLLAGILALLRARWRSQDVAFAREIADALLARFRDPEKGGFHQTAHDHEYLPWRPKPLADDALPAPNGIAALALSRLGHLLGEPRYLEAAEGAVALAMPAMDHQPLGHATLIRALAEQLAPPEIATLYGDPEALAPVVDDAAARFAPGRLTFVVPPGEEDDTAPSTQGADAVGVFCRGSTCDRPIHGVDAIRQRLSVA